MADNEPYDISDFMSKGMTIQIEGSGVLESWEYDSLQDYFQLVLRKIEKGRAEYGMDYLERSDESFLEQIGEELADLSGWSAMRFIKMARKKDGT